MPLSAWQIRGDGPHRLSGGAVALEKDLEDWIERDPRLLDAGLTVVQRQLSVSVVGKLDLLCVDPQGRATVVEIKRGALVRDTIAQALDYASAIASMPAHVLHDRIAEYLGPDATKNSPVAALLDASEGSDREVAVIVVGVGQDPAVDRMIDFLGSRFGMPIRAVTFDVFELEGMQVLVREETDSEPPTTAADDLPTYNRDAVIARAGGPASSSGRRMSVIAEAAERNGLFVRPYKRSLMITPPQNRTRFLMNMWTWAGRPDDLVISSSASAFAEFFPVDAPTVVEILGPNADAELVASDGEAKRWATGLDRLFATVRGETEPSTQVSSDT